MAAPADATTKVCFVCLGNICRSPLAEGVFRRLVDSAGMSHAFEIDSAGTGGWHAGELPDPRSRAVAAAHGLALTHRARQFQASDFARFDWIIAMDRANQRDLLAIAPLQAARDKVRLLRAFAGDATAPTAATHSQRASLDVPDPYHGDEAGFQEVYDLCLTACQGLLQVVLLARPG